MCGGRNRTLILGNGTFSSVVFACYFSSVTVCVSGFVTYSEVAISPRQNACADSALSTIEYGALVAGLIVSILAILGYMLGFAKWVKTKLKRRASEQPRLIDERTAREIVVTGLRRTMESSEPVITSARLEGHTWRIVGHRPYVTTQATLTEDFVGIVDAQNGTCNITFSTAPYTILPQLTPEPEESPQPTNRGPITHTGNCANLEETHRRLYGSSSAEPYHFGRARNVTEGCDCACHT